jgi:hypothetical protein
VLRAQAAYKNKAAHHVQAATKAAEEHDLVGGDHPLAAGLHNSVVSSLLLAIRSSCAARCDRRRVVYSRRAHAIPRMLPSSCIRHYAPFPRSSGHHASGIRAGSAVHGSHGRPSCWLSVTSSARETGGGQWWPSRVANCGSRAATAEELTYPAIVKSGDVLERVCRCNGWVDWGFGSVREVGVE